MNKYYQPHDLKAFGFQVKTFPQGIQEAFDHLIKRLPKNDKRSFYGISKFTPGAGISYFVAAEETFEGEAEKYNLERYTVEKGEYLTVTIKDWRNKTESIKDVFESMSKDDRVDKTKAPVEWYKNDNEMLCMMLIDKSKA